MAALTKDEILEAIASMSVLEASQLAKDMEKKFGVTATAPIMVAESEQNTLTETAEEQTEFSVTLESIDATKKIAVIKVVRVITGLGLKEAKDLVEGAPKLLKEGVNKEEAAKIKNEIEDAGGLVKVV
ncbi:50S ribosomal protein L7/L12 [Treponema endosymbiont of Eucomonympha sp.]|uniref:50S ribosomal protein L7/L12 n=1 Tax=Treponema endosymbiont of Eucomonympha sp. TaxID=1580831 RepID=UPI00075135B6|nr:50S ribosomal protein L7/L12 [Treponema endosymbiont of Eucomonympha sp.]